MPIASRSRVNTSTGKKPGPVRKPSDMRETLNMRIRPEVRRLIDDAAQITGKNRTDFVLDAARQAAQNTLLDQTIIQLDEKSHKAFLKLLEAPPAASERLRRSLKTKAVWN